MPKRAVERRKIIPGVDRYRVVEPWFEGVRVILSYRGEPYSPAYIQGITGAAFRVAGPCPCAPTCGHAMEAQDLVRLVGYEAEGLPLSGEGIDPAAQIEGVVGRVKEEIRAGRPALLWHAFTFAEWDVVCGYDDEARQFFGRGSYTGLEEYAAADERRTLTSAETCPSLGAILVGQKTGQLDARAAELAGLKAAVLHARTPGDRFAPGVGSAEWRFRNGLGCYEWWTHNFADPAKVPNMGDRYCLGVYRSTHRAATQFLRELAPRYPEATPHLDAAAGHFAAEAAALNACAELLFPGWQVPQKADPAVNAEAAALLSRAKEAYARGIDGIERALTALHGE